jgi:hypothetical protein
MAWWGHFYPQAIANFFGGAFGGALGGDGAIDWLSDTIKASGLSTAYTPAASHEKFSDLSGVVTTVTLASKSITYTGATKLLEIKGTYPNFGLTPIRWVAIYDDTHADKPLIGYLDLGSSWDGNFAGGEILVAQLTAIFQFVVDAYDAAGTDFGWYWYGKALANALGGETSGENRMTNWRTDDMKVALLTSSYTPNQDTHEVWADVSAYQISGTGYGAGGYQLDTALTTSIRVHPTIKRTELCAESGGAITWFATTLTNARYAVVYNATHADKPLLGFTDFRTNRSTSGATFEINIAPGYAGLNIQGANALLQITWS